MVTRKGGHMDNAVKWNVKALAASRKQTIKELAIEAGIDPQHLAYVSIGRVKMSTDDLLRLAKTTGVSPFEIQTN